jgi:hypothetical protein
VIYLRTGQPGVGKTLFALKDWRDIAEKDNRPVYYSGIDCNVPGWVELPDATKWQDVAYVTAPDGTKTPSKAIIIIDEAQRVFRPRHTGSAVPAHVQALETHRHLGIDLVLLTQHPKLLDSNVRRLVGVHKHYVRVFGSEAANEHQWEECNEDPDKSRADSISKIRAYPKEVYAWYKSAEVHTHKRRIPVRIILLPVLVLVAIASVIGVGYWVKTRLFRSSSEVLSTTGAQKPIEKVGERPGAASSSSSDRRAMTTPEYLQAHQPRIPGLAHTAPIYDGVTQVKVAPAPQACVSSGDRCECFTTQATRLQVPRDLCLQIVREGFFMQWHVESRDLARGGGAAVPGVAPSRPAAELPQAAPVVDEPPPVRGNFIRATGYEKHHPIASQLPSQ